MTEASEFVKDLAAAQAEMGNAAYNRTNPHFRSKYADFAAVREATLPVLTRHGFAVIQTTEFSDGVILLKTELAHRSGESRVSYYPIAPGTPQAQGSALTYARRYSWSAITGIASEEDDDGNAATTTNGAVKPKNPSQARKDGFYAEAEKALRLQTSLDGLAKWWRDNQDEIRALPPQWLALIEEEKDRCKLRLVDRMAEDSPAKQQLKASLEAGE